MTTGIPRLSLAVGSYDHVRDLVAGDVSVAGFDLAPTVLPAPELFARFLRERPWDIAEMSLGMYVSMLSRGDMSLAAIPVFPSRMFRHSAFFVKRGGGVQLPADLRGARIGFPDWSHTAGIWGRALLAHEFGVPLTTVTWVQAGMDNAGFTTRPGASLPEGFRFEERQDRSLDEMLRDGDIDAIVSAHTPAGATGNDAPIVRLIADSEAAETDYFRRTGIFPIMHVIALKRDVHEAHPALARSLVAAFTTAKERSLARMADAMVSHFPFPWTFQQAAAARALFGDDPWPYGVSRNRGTLEAFLGYAREQGVAARHVTVAELFPLAVID